VVACEDGLNLQEHLHSWSSTAGDAVCGLHAEDGDASALTCAQRFPNSKELQDEIRGKIVGEWTHTSRAFMQHSRLFLASANDLSNSSTFV
jgi:hypothetical protein